MSSLNFNQRQHQLANENVADVFAKGTSEIFHLCLGHSPNGSIIPPINNDSELDK